MRPLDGSLTGRFLEISEDRLILDKSCFQQNSLHFLIPFIGSTLLDVNALFSLIFLPPDVPELLSDAVERPKKTFN